MNATIAQIFTNGEIEYLEYDFEGRKKRRKGKPMDQEAAKENLLLLKNVFDKHGITFWLLYGTLLGAIRESQFIPYDTDTDVGVFMRDKNKIIAATPDLQQVGLELIRTKYPDDLITFMRKDEYIDVGLFKSKRSIFLRNYWYYQNKATHRVWDKYYKNFDTVNFCGAEFKIPQHVESFLVELYGPDWKSRKKDFVAYSYKNSLLVNKLIRISKNIIRKVLGLIYE